LALRLNPSQAHAREKAVTSLNRTVGPRAVKRPSDTKSDTDALN